MTETTIGQLLARAGTAKHVEENALAEAYIKADRALGEQKIRLVDHLSAEKKGDKIIPVFDDGVEDVLPDLDAVRKEAFAVKKDVSSYIELLGSAQSIARLTEQLGHLKIIVRNAEFSAKNILEREIKSSGKSSGECMVASVVTNAYAHADRLYKENAPKIDDLLSRIKEAREILEKY